MSSDFTNPLDDRRKAQEEDYFRKQNQEVAEKLKARLTMQEAGVSDPELAEKLGRAGYDQDSARALIFIPIFEVAWADASLDAEEKHLIVELRKQKSIEEGSKAFGLIETWLTQRPNDEAFMTGKALIGPIVEELKSNDPDLATWISASAEQIASAAGGLFGFGNRISTTEKETLKSIASRLKQKS